LAFDAGYVVKVAYAIEYRPDPTCITSK
jgi:hypothetical protein